MVKKAPNADAVQLLVKDRRAIHEKLDILDDKIQALQFKIDVAGANGKKVNFDKLNEYYPKLDVLYKERNAVEKEYAKLERRLESLDPVY